MKRLRVSMLWLLAVGVAAGAVAQSGGLRQFEDRTEGVMTLHSANLTQFDLVGIEVVSSVEPQATVEVKGTAEEVQLCALLPPSLEGETLVARVRDPLKHYWMIPHNGSLKTANPVFVWTRAAVLKPRQITIDRLRPLVSNLAETVYYPAWIVGRDDAVETSGPHVYRFSFDSRGAVYAQARVWPEQAVTNGDEKGVIELPDVEESFSGAVIVTWDSGALPAPSGLYYLTLQGELVTNDVSPLEQSVAFYHHAGGS